MDTTMTRDEIIKTGTPICPKCGGPLAMTGNPEAFCCVRCDGLLHASIAKIIPPGREQRLIELAEFHRSEMKNYSARALQCDNPTAAQWLNDMAARHEQWMQALETILREAAPKGDQTGT